MDKSELETPIVRRGIVAPLAVLVGVCLGRRGYSDEAGTRDLKPRTIDRGQQSGHQSASNQVIQTQDAWVKLWQLHRPGKQGEGTLPKVDFEKETVLAVFDGTRNTGGFAVEIQSVREMAGKLTVQVLRTRPSADGALIQVLTSPFHLVAIPKSTLPVVWKGSAIRR